MPTTALNPYDEVPYDSHPFAQSQPERLATIATLLGLTPPAVDTARVLELGCAAGGNLVPLADRYPGGRFVGIDLSGRQIGQGRAVVEALGLTNVELKVMSIGEVPGDFGEFDYVVCHGVYSWVPPEIQRAILQVCSQHLAPGGVAYVSYNVYPGWHMRGIARDMMLYHTRRFEASGDRVGQARAFLDFVAKAIGSEKNTYGAFLNTELQLIRRSADSYLLHEHLEEHNAPVYFHEFAARAEAEGLRFLAEADLGVMVPGHFPAEVADVLQRLAADLVELEQFMDFLRNRMFRQSLLVRENAAPSYALSGARLAGLHVASRARQAEPPAEMLPAGRPVVFEGAGDIRMTAGDPLVQVALGLLQEAYPASVPFAELVDRSLTRTGVLPEDASRAAAAGAIGETLLKVLTTATPSPVELTTLPARLTAAPGEFPLAPALARHQAALGDLVTNARHEQVRLSPLARQTLPRLDGRHDRPALLAHLTGAVAKGDLTINSEGRPVTDPERVAEIMGEALTVQLRQFGLESLLLRQAAPAPD